MNKPFLLLLTFMMLSIAGFSQQTDEQLAAQYFSNNEFDKAADLYEKLINKNPSSVYIYDNLLQCYFNLKQFDNAEKLVKKQQRRFDGNAYYKVDLGYVYKKSGDNEKANKYFEEIYKTLKGGETQTIDIANAFQKRGELDLAIQTYVRSRKLNGNDKGIFAVQLAQLYGTKRDTKAMLEEYMNALQVNPLLEEDIQGYLQVYLDNPQDYELLKNTLLKWNREYPGVDAYSEMLIWLYVQRKDFDNALVQAKALDKRYKEDGRRVYELANLAVQNEQYDAAIRIYNYIISLGKEKPFYLASVMGVLDTRNKKITLTNSYTEFDIKTLETEYENFLKEEGRYQFTAPAIRELARLEAYYLHNYDKSIGLFKELIEMPRLDTRFKAECKLELGDIYVLKGEVWEAVLLYGQVDKDFLEDPLGQEAKFRNARLSYYMGEFEWARAQLDVLKTATSQLIANNALELSLLIQDNTLDSIEEPLMLFAKADLNYYQNHMDEALQLLDSINLLYPRHSLDDDILFKRAQIFYKKRDYVKSASYLEQLLKEHGSDILGDNALFMLAQMTEKELNDKPKAMKLYEQFIEQYPGSFYLSEVSRRYRLLRGDQLN